MPTVLQIRCRKQTTRVLYYIFGIMGGFYCSDLLSRSMRNAWWTINVIGALFGSISITVYMISTSNMGYSEVLYMCGFAACIFYAVVFIPAVTYHYRRNLRTILDYIDIEYDSNQPETRIAPIRRKTYDIIPMAIKWFIWLFSLETVFAFSNIAYLVLVCDRSCLRNRLIYIGATPFTERVHSIKVYSTIFIIHTFFQFAAAVQANCMVTFAPMIGNELHNTLVNLSAQFHRLIDDTVSNLRLADKRLKTGPPAQGQENAEQIESSVFETFKTNLAVVVKRHQELTRGIRMLRPWIQIMGTVNLLNFFWIQTPYAYIVLVSECELLLKIKAAFALVVVSNGIYSSFLLGSILEDINRMMMDEVYSSKWYDMPSKYRKMVHIFQSQFQQPIRCFALKIYPVTIATFAHTLQFLYTITNLLRQSQILGKS